MKKKKILTLLLILLCIIPYSVSAKTIKEFEEEVNKFTKDLEDKKNKIAQNDADVAQIKENIAQIEGQIKGLEQETEALQKEIDKSNEEIEQKSKESKELFQYLQISKGNTAYLEYIFGAESVTDMIYRMSVVEQLTAYNDKIMKELQELIEKNKARKEDLAKKKEELNKLTEQLEEEKEKINAETNTIKSMMPGIEEQLKAAQGNLKYYKDLGCGATEDIQVCQVRIDRQRAQSSSSGGGSIPLPPSVSGFYTPMENGYVTQEYRGYPGHMGMDFSSYNKTEPIYPIAAGVVFYIGYDACTNSWCPYGCNGRAKMIKIRHNVGGTYIYSTYGHLSNFGNVSVGTLVTPDTVIGYMGTTGCSTGSHLHMEITSCDWNYGGGCTSSQYNRSTINPRRYISFPSGLRQSWSGR